MHISALKNAQVGIWGAGREGAAALRALRAYAAPTEITVVTDQPPSAAERARCETSSEVRFVWGDQGIAALLRCDVVIRSPGVSVYRPEHAELVTAGVSMTTGTNLWFAEHADELVIGVTGTKGKSTTAALLAHALARLGIRAPMVGNIGQPLLDWLRPESPPDAWVVELSSYHTADIRFTPRVGVLLNLSREHLNWHGTEERYYRDKLNLFAHRADGQAVLNWRDHQVRSYAGHLPAVTWFGRGDGYSERNREIWHADRPFLPAGSLPLPGRRNVENACAALAALNVAGWNVTDPDVFRGFHPLPHRLEIVAEGDGLIFVDDSIATTPKATLAALDAFAGRPIAVLVGGQDRRQDYTELADMIIHSADVRAVVALPDNGLRVLSQIRAQPGELGCAAQLFDARNLEEAVATAVRSLPDGGVVLLSPGAPSFGHFRDFEERGERFAEAARRAIGHKPPP